MQTKAKFILMTLENFDQYLTKKSFINFISLVQDYLDNAFRRKEDSTLTVKNRAEVVANSLNVRSGPAGDKPFVKSISKGIVVTIFEIKGGWVRISDKDQEWIYGQYVKEVA